jgi:two-component system sensor histidine kinase TctE
MREMFLSLRRRLLHRLLAPLLAEQAEHQRRFIADAAHQLRTPLAGLQSQVEAWAQAARRIVPPGGSGSLLVPVDQVDKLRNATRRTTQLANQLLALSRAEARTTSDHPMEPVDLRALAGSVLETYLDRAAARRIDLGMALEGDGPESARAWGQEWLLRELLANLVDNAIKYTPEGGTITIGGGLRPGGPAWLSVEDDGPGVPEALLPRLLDRFYRVPGSTGEGTGLGLAIVDEIARVHRGRLLLGAGAEGRGLRVVMEWPGSRAPLASAEP